MAEKVDNTIVGLDIGTTKVCAVVGQDTQEGKIKIIGIGQSPSKGLRKGVVINIDDAVMSIKRAVSQAERMSGHKITSVYTGIAGSHIRSYNSSGVVAIKNSEVSESDIRRVIDAAKAVAIPPDREIIHIIPQEFIVDDQDGIKEPRGMSGTRLEVKVHIVTGAIASVQNIVKCCQKSGLKVDNIVLQPIASSISILMPEEKDLGVGLIDMGGGTTDIAIFVSNAIRHTSVISIGGDHITNDIAIGLRTPFQEAEKVKIEHGCAVSDMIDSDETIEIPGVGNRGSRVIPRKALAQIIEPRMEEVFSLINDNFEKMDIAPILTSGIVLTGGSALMEGSTDLAESVFGLPVRMGKPIGVIGLKDAVDNPMYATGVGLVLYGFDQAKEHKNVDSFNKAREDKEMFSAIFRKMKSWIKDML